MINSRFSLFLILLVSLIFASGCISQNAPDNSGQTPVNSQKSAQPEASSQPSQPDLTTETGISTQTPESQEPAETQETTGVFPLGIYYKIPGKDNPSAVISFIGEGFDEKIDVPPSGFDIKDNLIVYSDNQHSIFVHEKNGNTRAVNVPGLNFISRPSFSPDKSKVVVQATEQSTVPENGKGFDIYVINLSDGSSKKISQSEFNDESPEWFPHSNKIAYSEFSPTTGINIHIYDLYKETDKVLVADGGAIHLDISNDEKFILNPQTFTIYSASDGSLISNLRDSVIRSLRSKGYDIDSRYPGQANKGTFPLDGSFSPDGSKIVLDGAVTINGKYGIILFTVDKDGKNFTVLSELIEINPEFSNNNNYSPLNPLWVS